MKRFSGVLLFYILLAVVLLPLAVTLLLGGFGKELPQEARRQEGFREEGINISTAGNNSIGGAIQYEEKRKEKPCTDHCALRLSVSGSGGGRSDLSCL